MRKNMYKRKIWIDFDNSPHVPFFRPIVEELNKRGYLVTLTARDCFQVCGLADLYGLTYKRIGRHYGKVKLLKLFGMLFRAFQLMPTALSEKPDMALSHGSRSQLLAASILGIPSIMIYDYEYTRKFPFMHSHWVMVPEILPDEVICQRKEHILKYPDIKENVYIQNFTPDPGIRDKLGIDKKDLVITVRPPATEAHYHNSQSDELFMQVIETMGRANVRIVLLPRNDKQVELIRDKWPDLFANNKIIVPDHVVDGLNLIWHSDLVISGGGTMNREAAALGVPVYSIFRGKVGAVDRYLAETNRLILIENEVDVKSKIVLSKRLIPQKPLNANRDALHRIVDNILAVMEGKQRF